MEKKFAGVDFEKVKIGLPESVTVFLGLAKPFRVELETMLLARKAVQETIAKCVEKGVISDYDGALLSFRHVGCNSLRACGVRFGVSAQRAAYVEKRALAKIEKNYDYCK